MDETYNKLNIIKKDFLEKLQEHLNVKQYLLIEQILDQYTLLIEANLEPEVPDEIPDLYETVNPEANLPSGKNIMHEIKNNLSQAELTEERRRLQDRIAELEQRTNLVPEPLKVPQPPLPPSSSMGKMNVQELEMPVEEEEDFDDENLELVDDPEYDEKGINRVPVEKTVEPEKPKISLQERIKMMHEARKNKVKPPKAPNVYN